ALREHRPEVAELGHGDRRRPGGKRSAGRTDTGDHRDRQDPRNPAHAGNVSDVLRTRPVDRGLVEVEPLLEALAEPILVERQPKDALVAHVNLARGLVVLAPPAHEPAAL